MDPIDIDVERLRLELYEAVLANERKRNEWPEENAVEVSIKSGRPLPSEDKETGELC